MIRILSYVVLVFLLAWGFAWLADRPGDMIITWQGVQYQVSLLVAVSAVVAMIAAVMISWWLVRTLINSPMLSRRHFRARKRDRGYQSLSTGIIAAGAGDSVAARRMAKQASNLLSADQEPLIKLLDAQATMLEGDHEGARKKFEAMTDDPETRLIGLRGLFLEAERFGDVSAARQIAEKAAETSPQLAWAGKVAMESRITAGDYDGAIKLLDQQKSSKIIGKDDERRRRAVLLTAKAVSLIDTDSSAARIAASEANRFVPEFVPAAAVLARALIKQKDARKASRTLEYTWKLNPHPELAELYVHANGTDSAEVRLKRARTLASYAPDHVESDIAIARAALAANKFDEARKAAEAALAKAPRESIHLILADIEQADRRDTGKVRQHLARALRAPRDPAWTADGLVSERWLPVSPVSGRIDAFEWKVPVERLQPLVEHVVDEPEPVVPVIEASPEPMAEAPAKIEVVPAVAEQPKTEPVAPIVSDSVAPKRAKAEAVSDMMPMIPDDPGVRPGDPANQPKRFRLF